ncbi:MAG: GWxTD domain-containing protein [Candidatus Zixiibacteriota bacterium]
MKHIFKSIFASLLLSTLVFAQTDFSFLEELKGKEFYTDMALFREKDRWRLEAYFKIFNHKLSFLKQKDKYRASYEVHLKVFDSHNRQVTATSIEENYEVASYLETTSKTSFLINQLKTQLLPGRYKLEFTLNDLNSPQRWSKKIDLEVPDLIRERATLSSIEFARSISDTLMNPKFEKNGKEVIPSVSRAFGDPDSKIYIYYEIYKGKVKHENYILEYRARDVTSREMIINIQDTVKAEKEVHRVFKNFNMEKLPEGEYVLFLNLLDPEGKVLDDAEEKFYVKRSILSLLKTDYQKAVEQLRYIASPEEMNKLKEAKEEERLQAWIDFWRAKDPTPQTVENELQEEYYRRLAYANANFGIFQREGWTTDMGRIYIIYGHPDEVERHPFERERKPYQIWYYYQRNIQIIFVDESGYGEYEIESIYERGFKKR